MVPVLGSADSKRDAARRTAGLALFLLVAAAGLYWAKWHPYWGKAWTAAEKHSLGNSILTGGAPAPPAPSWAAAWQYALAYFKAVWPALVVGLLLGSLVQVLVPREWLRRLLGQRTYRSTLAGGLLALPGMMCTCCSAPVVVGLRRSACTPSAAAAFWLGNTALNPAVLVFMAFVLPWKFAVLRLLFGALLVFGASAWVNRLACGAAGQGANRAGRNGAGPGGESEAGAPWAAGTGTAADTAPWGLRWGRSLLTLGAGLLPAYLVSVLVLGGVRGWLFPAAAPAWGNSLWAMGLLAVAGALFVIPTAAEIPIVQALLASGLGAGPAAALLITLPAISLPSALMVRRVFSWRVIGALFASVIAAGVLCGLTALAWV